MCWEASKAVARRTIIAVVNKARSDNKQMIWSDETDLQQAEKDFSDQPSDLTHEKFCKAQRALELARTSLTEKKVAVCSTMPV